MIALGEQYICSKLVEIDCNRFFLLRFEQVFFCWIYFSSVYIMPMVMMLFNNFLTDVNIDLTKLRLCMVTKIQRF